MHSLRVTAENLFGVYRGNAFWMTWNLFLAFIPVVLAPFVFRHRGERTPLWWTGLALFVLFLPNAPYVITDLVHLDGDVRAAANDTAVLTGVLPVYAVFIGLGVLAYTFSLVEVGRYLDRVGLAARRLPIELGIHFAGRGRGRAGAVRPAQQLGARDRAAHDAPAHRADPLGAVGGADGDRDVLPDLAQLRRVPHAARGRGPHGPLGHHAPRRLTSAVTLVT